MENDLKSSEPFTPDSLRKGASSPLEKAKATAKEVADLCARAKKAAHRRNVPHASVGPHALLKKKEDQIT